MIQKGEQYTVTAGGYASDGSAVARVDGMAVFVKGAIRGETCRIRIEHVGHRAAWAGITELTAPSPHRIRPDCPHYPLCGGCQTRHMDYEEELFFKKSKVEDALRRIGGLELTVSAIHGGAPDGYRNKVQFPVGPGPAVGFYEGRSHRVVDVSRCALQPDWANALADALRRWMADYSVPAYEEKSRKGLIRHLFARGNSRGECVAAVVVNGSSLPHRDALVEALRAAAPGLRGVVLNENRRDTNVVLGDKFHLLWGTDTLLDPLRGLTFRLSIPSFYQVNHDQAEALYGLAADFAALTGRERVLDLYCGTGTIGLTMAGRCKALLGAEIVPQAVADAKENASRNGITNARFVCSDASEVAARLAAEGGAVDVAIVDPPRKGLAPQVVESLLKIAPGRIVYVSCDPATLARDLKLLAPSYTPLRAECVDMFPRTAHIETVVKLERK